MLNIRVPAGYASPFPLEWSAEDNALAVDIGVDALRRLRARHDVDGTTAEEARRQCEQLLSSLLADRKPLENEIVLLQTKMNIEMERAEAKVAKADEEARLERERSESTLYLMRARAREEAQQQARDDLYRVETRAMRAEEEVRSEREAQRRIVVRHEEEVREREVRHQEDKRRLAALVTQAEKRADELTCELRAKTELVAQLGVSANKGNAVERELGSALRDTGLFVVDTSKGVHNTHYHDMLVATRPLHQTVCAHTTPPRYEADETAVRCSLEAKAHSRSNGIGAEREKFSEVRRRMMENRCADCFVFAAKTTIPGQLRWHFEFVNVAGRHSITGYVGAPDLSATEVCLLVQLVTRLQEKLNGDTLFAPRRPTESVLSEFVDAITNSLHSLREQIARCDNMERATQTLRDETRAIRASTVASMFQHVSLLTNSGFPPTDDTLVDVRDAHNSLTSTRLSNCKILRNKDQFRAAQAALSTFSGKRDRE